MHKVPRAAAQIEPTQPRALAQKLRDGLEEADIVVVADHDEAELLEVREEGVHAVDDVVAAEDDARGTRLFERPVQSQTLESVRMGYAREHDVRDAGVDELEVSQVADCRRLEGVVPGVVPLEVGAEREVPERALVVVEHGADLAHVCEPVVVFGAEDEFTQAAEGALRRRDAFLAHI